MTGETPAEKRGVSQHAYEDYRDKQAAGSRVRSESGRDIKRHGPPADPARKAACRDSFQLFCESYFPQTFHLKWSDDHLEAIACLELAVKKGGQKAFAMPRGTGKTVLCEVCVQWATLYDWRSFVVLIGASADAAEDSLVNIKLQLETNDLLAADFPEVCHYIRALEGNSTRANMQTVGGQRTRIIWKGKQVVFPTVPGSAASGNRIRIAGMDGRIRGLTATTATGESIRPDLAIVDDFQTDESARSPAQCHKRLRVLDSAVLGLAGPKKKIACFAPCTVIAPGDAADRLLDREANPVWQGQRSRLVLAWPTNRDLWDRYSDLRKSGQRLTPPSVEAANEFYRANREAMDAGAALSWPERFRDGEDSAVQYAMNLVCDHGRAMVDAEYQNDPQPELAAGQLPDLDAEAISRRTTNAPRGEVPPECTRLTAFIDCGKDLLWWCVCGWSEGYRHGRVVDYGTFPRQNRAYFSKRDASVTLAGMFTREAYSDEALLFAGLKALTGELLGRQFSRPDAVSLPIGLCLVDSGYLTSTVVQVVRQSPYRGQLAPSKGIGVTASRPPMDLWTIKEGERKGDNWRQRPDRLTVYDTNHWKTFTAARLETPEGGRGALQLFGKSEDHHLFADHLTAESRTQTAGHGRTLHEWSLKPGRDNDWFDCLVGCAVAASVLGVKWDSAVAAGEQPRAAQAKKVVKLSDLYKEKHGRGR